MIKYHLDYGISKELMQSTLGKDDAILSEWFWIIDLDPDHSKGTHKISSLNFCLNAKKLAIVLHSEHVEMKETSEKLLKIIITLSGPQLVLKQ